MTESVDSARHQLLSILCIAEVQFQVAHPICWSAESVEDTVNPEGVCSPRLFGIMRSPGMAKHRRSVIEQATGDRETDARPPTHASHQCDLTSHATSLPLHWRYSLLDHTKNDGQIRVLPMLSWFERLVQRVERRAGVSPIPGVALASVSMVPAPHAQSA